MVAELRETHEACNLAGLEVDSTEIRDLAGEIRPLVRVRDVDGREVADFFVDRGPRVAEANAAFYVAAYNAVPALLHENSRLRREIFGQAQRGAELLDAARALRVALEEHQGLTDEQVALVRGLGVAAGPKGEGS